MHTARESKNLRVPKALFPWGTGIFFFVLYMLILENSSA